MRAGAALQGRLGLHLPTARVKGEDTIGAFSMFVAPTKDVDLPITHRHATALLSNRQTVNWDAPGTSAMWLSLALHTDQAIWMAGRQVDCFMSHLCSLESNCPLVNMAYPVFGLSQKAKAMLGDHTRSWKTEYTGTVPPSYSLQGSWKHQL